VARWDLVIFDCDGVLVDSEPIANRVFSEMLGEIGLPMSYDETVRTFVGRSMSACLDIVEERLGRPAPAGVADAFHARTVAAFEGALRPVPHVETALEALAAAGVPVCVASSGTHEKMRATLGMTGLLGRLDGRLFSATEVPRGKPFPDVFLHAAACSGAHPSRSAVVEDTVLGVTAAVAAGMATFGYARLTDAESLRAAGARVFTDMRDLPGLLGVQLHQAELP